MNSGDDSATNFAPDDGERTMIRTTRNRVAQPQPRAGWVHYLTYTDDTGVAQRLRLVEGMPVRIGRRLPCELVLRDAEVSGVHCELLLRADDLMVSDRGSTNGTFVDGKRVFANEPVPPGGMLQVGRQMLKHEFRDEQELAQSQELNRDLARASHYVQSLLPQPLHSGPVRVDWHFQPSTQVGGDVFGYHALDEHRLVLYLVDVSGHGVGAAMHGVAVLGSLRQQTLPDTDYGRPAQVLERLNALYPMDGHAGMFFTIWYGVLDRRDWTLDYASAGHHPSFVWSPDGAPLQALQTPNLVIGAMEDVAFDAARTQLRPGQKLYIFSDGVFEIVTREGQTWGLPDFLPLLGTAAAAAHESGVSEPEHLFKVVQGLARPGPLDDDFSLVVAQIL